MKLTVSLHNEATHPALSQLYGQTQANRSTSNNQNLCTIHHTFFPYSPLRHYAGLQPATL
jgi:hypothetical protein